MNPASPPTASDRQWIWQSCNEFGFFQTASSSTAHNLSHPINPPYPPASDRPWIWQSCNEFGFFQTASSSTAHNLSHPIKPPSFPASDRQWIWQSCNEFGFFQTASSLAADNPFSSWGASLDADTAGRDVCASAFGLPGYSGPALGPGGRLAALDEYGGRQILETNLTIITGGMDPWKALGVVSPADPFFESGGGTQVLGNGVTVAQVAGGAHCRDMYAPAAFEGLSSPVKDTASVRAVQARVAADVARYVGLARREL
jgi:hypothetical protein